MTVRVLIADDHQIIREGLRHLLEQSPGMAVVGEVDNGRDAVAVARRQQPDVAVMDIAMPGLNGIEATARIRQEAPGTRVVALSMHNDGRFVRRMLMAGASGYLLKDCAFDELVDAIETVQRGETYLSPQIASLVVQDYLLHLHERPAEAVRSLSDREREVLQLLVEGQSTRAVAEQLHLSVKTIETHRRNIMDRLQLNSLAELTKYAIREGLTTLD